MSVNHIKKLAKKFGHGTRLRLELQHERFAELADVSHEIEQEEKSERAIWKKVKARMIRQEIKIFLNVLSRIGYSQDKERAIVLDVEAMYNRERAGRDTQTIASKRVKRLESRLTRAEKQKIARHNKREQVLPSDRICPNCGEKKLRSRQWRLSGGRYVCVKCARPSIA